MQKALILGSIVLLKACSSSPNEMRGEATQSNAARTASEVYSGANGNGSTSDAVPKAPKLPDSSEKEKALIPSQTRDTNTAESEEKATPPVVIGGVYLNCLQLSAASAEYPTAVDSCRIEDDAGKHLFHEAFAGSSSFKVISALPDGVNVVVTNNTARERDSDIRVEFRGQDPGLLNTSARSLRAQFVYTDKAGVSSQLTSTADPQLVPLQKLVKNWSQWKSTQNAMSGVEHKTLGLKFAEIITTRLTNAYAMQTCAAFAELGLVWRLATLSELRLGYDAGLFLPEMIAHAGFLSKAPLNSVYWAMPNGSVVQSFDSGTGQTLQNSPSDQLVFLCVAG